jgi:hypothetical protein
MDIKRQPSQSASSGDSARPSRVRPFRHPVAFLVLTVVFIFVSFGSILGAAVFVKMTLAESQMVRPDSAKYQAVFMTNGQVYFGKLSGVSSKYQVLSDVYYLQVQQAVQPAATDNKDAKISLTKLGKELHGPTDRMNISSEQVLFWEDLNDDSAIVKAIENYKSKQ